MHGLARLFIGRGGGAQRRAKNGALGAPWTGPTAPILFALLWRPKNGSSSNCRPRRHGPTGRLSPLGLGEPVYLLFIRRRLPRRYGGGGAKWPVMVPNDGTSIQVSSVHAAAKFVRPDVAAKDLMQSQAAGGKSYGTNALTSVTRHIRNCCKVHAGEAVKWRKPGNNSYRGWRFMWG